MNSQTKTAPDLERIPFALGRRPFIGHAVPFLEDPVGFLASLAGHDALCRIQLGPLTVVVVCDPEIARKVLLDDLTFDKGGPFYDRSREVAGNGLGTCPHAEHRRQRRLCAPAFRAERLPGYAEIMTDSVEKMLQRWNDGAVIDIIPEMTALTVDIAVRTMFSTALPDNVIRQAAGDLSVIAEGLFRRTVLPPTINRLPTPDNRRFARSRRRMRTMAAEFIAERRAQGGDRGDLLSALMNARDPDSAGAATMSDEELIDQTFTFFLAGAETTSSTLAWALYLLGRNRDAAGVVDDEIDSVLTEKTTTFEDLARLPAVGRVVNETLRLYPPGWLVTRTVTRGAELDRIAIPVGTVIAISPHLAHRSAEVYPRPDDFLPDRWIDSVPGRADYIPFGVGSRMCIGEQFARTEATLVLAAIAARWQLSPLNDQPISVSLTDLPAPRTLRMRATKREPGRRRHVDRSAIKA